MLNFSENPNIENTKIKEILWEEEYKKFVNKLIIQRADCDKYIANLEKEIEQFKNRTVEKYLQNIYHLYTFVNIKKYIFIQIHIKLYSKS